MSDLEIIIIYITLGFALWLVAKKVFSKKICAICFAVFSVWVVLLIMYNFGYFEGQVIIALLMGQSITGIYYLLEKKIGVFRLPFILTLLVIFYSALTLSLPSFLVIIYLFFLWLTLFLLPNFKNKKIKVIVRQIIECCKNW